MNLMWFNRRRLWKLYVPDSIKNAVDQTPVEVSLEYHKGWDAHVCAIAGGMTLMQPERGKWLDSGGALCPDHMLPVQIACTKRQIIKIARMTKTYYNQESVFFYKVSDEAYLV